MNDTTTRQISIQCKDEHVNVSYGNGSIHVNPTTREVCTGFDVLFNFAGPPGTAQIIPTDSADDSWLKKTDIQIPTGGSPVVVDTSQATPDVDHYYTISIAAQDSDGIDFTIAVDPIVRPR